MFLSEAIVSFSVLASKENTRSFKAQRRKIKKTRKRRWKERRHDGDVMQLPTTAFGRSCVVVSASLVFLLH
jgi:hypothetical protein